MSRHVTYVTLGVVPIGKSRRIVIDVEDIALKRDLYSVLAAEGRSLKEWFACAVGEYLAHHSKAPVRRDRALATGKDVVNRASRKRIHNG